MLYLLLTRMKRACHLFLGSLWSIDAETLDIYFPFLRRLVDLGVPLNKADFTGG